MSENSTSLQVHSVTIGVTEFAFSSLAKQNMTCYQCLMELVDNAVAASDNEKAVVQIVLLPVDATHIKIIVMDWGRGMTLDELSNALQLGSVPSSESRLNEHGFGAKNALTSMTENVEDWSIQTHRLSSPHYMVHGPFATEMYIEEVDEFVTPDGLVPGLGQPSTIVTATVSLTFAQSLQRRGSRCTDLVTLRSWLVEHLGVAYRGYLLPAPDTMEPSAKIVVTVGTDSVLVPPVVVPYSTEKTERFSVELNGIPVPIEYHYGLLDIDKRDHLVAGAKAKAYYLGTQSTQGIDIRLGKRVISTAMLGEIWHTADGTPLARHNSYNEFVGELIIPDIPRGTLTTLNNKTGINPADCDWCNLFETLATCPPPKSIRSMCEATLQKRWVEILHAANPQDHISRETCVWQPGTRIDVLRESDGGLTIYELKLGKAEPINVYQLRMYWDGLVLAGHQPTAGVLIVQSYSSAIQAMVDTVNTLPPPKLDNGTFSLPYHFSLSTHSDRCLGNA